MDNNQYLPEEIAAIALLAIWFVVSAFHIFFPAHDHFFPQQNGTVNVHLEQRNGLYPNTSDNDSEDTLVEDDLPRLDHDLDLEPGSQQGESSGERASERVGMQGQQNGQSSSGLDSEAYDQGVGQQRGYDHVPGPDEVGRAL